MKRKIFLRGDGVEKVGFGHVSRLMAISEILKKHFDCTLAISKPDDFVKQQLVQIHLEIFELPSSKQKSELSFLNELKGNEIVVLDGYDFNLQFQKKIRSKGCKLVVIDDFNTGKQIADVIINHSLLEGSSKYQAALYTKLKLGWKYLIVRNYFQKISNNKNENRTKLKKAIISFGNTDKDNITRKILLALINIGKFNAINIIIGSSNKNINSIIKLKEKHHEIDIRIHSYLGSEEIGSIIKQSDLAIVSASTIAYECCKIGVGLLVGHYTANQKLTSDALKNAKCALVVSKSLKSISIKKLESIINSYSHSEKRINLFNQRKYFKNSSNNLLEIFQQLDHQFGYNLRQASSNDEKFLLSWANDPVVRKMSFNSSKITPKEHHTWFQEQLVNRYSFILILTKGKKNIGQIRFENRGKAYIIDYSINKSYRGKKLGKMIVTMGLEYLSTNTKGEKNIIAKVKNINKASNNALIDNSFEIMQESKLDISFFKFGI